MRIVANLLAAHAGKHHVALEVDVAPDLAVRADPDQLQQVLLNLALNAIDACANGGHVTLRAKPDGKLGVFEVIDDGAGIPRELLTKVFDPFFTTKKRGQGTGLGLWVVAQLVRAHAGEIELDSTVGAGTKVKVVWPTG
jgi:signal transduction histidine kinase